MHFNPERNHHHCFVLDLDDSICVYSSRCVATIVGFIATFKEREVNIIVGSPELLLRNRDARWPLPLRWPNRRKTDGCRWEEDLIKVDEQENHLLRHKKKIHNLFSSLRKSMVQPPLRLLSISGAISFSLSPLPEKRFLHQTSVWMERGEDNAMSRLVHLLPA